MTFGRLLQSIREERGLTQQQLAEAAGLALGSVRNSEQGINLPSLPHAVQLARALGVSVEVLTNCEELRPPPIGDGKKGARS